MADQVGCWLVVPQRVPRTILLIDEVERVVALVGDGTDQLAGIELKTQDHREEVVAIQTVAATTGQWAHMGQTHGLAERFQVLLQNEHDLRRIGPGLCNTGVVVIHP